MWILHCGWAGAPNPRVVEGSTLFVLWMSDNLLSNSAPGYQDYFHFMLRFNFAHAALCTCVIILLEKTLTGEFFF